MRRGRLNNWTSSWVELLRYERGFRLQAWITGKRLKIDGYIQRGVLQALNPLYNHVTLSQGRTKGRQKCATNVLKWQTFKLTCWITGKRLKIDGYMLQCVWQALNSLSIHVKFIVIVPRAYPGKPKCAVDSLDVAKCLHQQRHTGVTLVR